MTETDSRTAPAPVLPRELTSLPAEVAAVGAPPIPLMVDPWAVRLAVAERDAELVSEWMNRPHLAEAWEYAWPPQRWSRHIQAQLDGRYSRPLVVTYEGRGAGYLEVYRAAKDSIATRYDAGPHDLGLHVAIAEDEFVHRGVALSLVPMVLGSLFRLDPDCTRIMFDPDHRNRSARRVCEQAGFEFLGEHDMPNRRMALYALNR